MAANFLNNYLRVTALVAALSWNYIILATVQLERNESFGSGNKRAVTIAYVPVNRRR